MKLVGASWSFIRGPFLRKNVWSGVLAGNEEILKGFVRGIFLACGYIKDPAKEYALDFFIDRCV